LIGKWKDFDWKEEKIKWDKAFSGCGIIETKSNEKILEPWRAMTVVEGYVCCIKSKIKLVRKIVEEIKIFKNDRKRLHKSCMLISSSGSGKSFLVSCIAKDLDIRYLSFNITQMLSKSDILDCFDSIVTTQAQNHEEPILVFIDEINAKLHAQYTYDTFLSPLEKGVYTRSGKAFHIPPCFWIFAGTERPIEKKGDEKLDESTKARDFESRLTLPPINLKIDVKEQFDNDKTIIQEGQVERVYCGVSILRSFFPDVRKISEKVLKVFSDMRSDLQIRELEHFVKSFENIQYGQVVWENIKKAAENYDIGLEKWKTEKEGDMVELKK